MQARRLAQAAEGSARGGKRGQTAALTASLSLSALTAALTAAVPGLHPKAETTKAVQQAADKTNNAGCYRCWPASTRTRLLLLHGDARKGSAPSPTHAARVSRPQGTGSVGDSVGEGLRHGLLILCPAPESQKTRKLLFY